MTECAASPTAGKSSGATSIAGPGKEMRYFVIDLSSRCEFGDGCEACRWVPRSFPDRSNALLASLRSKASLRSQLYAERQYSDPQNGDRAGEDVYPANVETRVFRPLPLIRHQRSERRSQPKRGFSQSSGQKG